MKWVTQLVMWLRSVYSESDGSGSSTRVHLGLLIAFVIGVGITFCICVCRGHLSLTDFNAFLGAATLFLTSVGGFLYGINKAADVLSGKQNSNNNASAS
jgi:hypothetical protein